MLCTKHPVSFLNKKQLVIGFQVCWPISQICFSYKNLQTWLKDLATNNKVFDILKRDLMFRTKYAQKLCLKQNVICILKSLDR